MEAEISPADDYEAPFDDYEAPNSVQPVSA